MNTSSKGFTIVELLVVIVVIAILASISIISYTGIQDRARTTMLVSALNQSAKQISAYQTVQGTYPASLSDANISSDSEITYDYQVTSGSDPSYCLMATTGNISYRTKNTSTTPQKGGCPGRGVGGQPALTNYVTDPSFESNPTLWGFASSANYQGTVTTEQARFGQRSYKITASGSGEDRYLEMIYPSTAGKTYVVSGYVYITSTNQTFRNGDVMFNAAPGRSTNEEPMPAYDRSKLNQWQRVSRRMTMVGDSSGNVGIRVRFMAPLNSTLYVDGVMVTETDNLTPYADGDSQDWLWTGTPHRSRSTGPTL